VWGGGGGRGGGSGQLPAVPMSAVLCPLQPVLIKVKDADAGQRQAVLTFTVYTSCRDDVLRNVTKVQKLFS
jgi:hypothetical protein